MHYSLGRIWNRNTAVKANSPVGMILLEDEEKEDQRLRRTKKLTVRLFVLGAVWLFSYFTVVLADTAV